MYNFVFESRDEVFYILFDKSIRNIVITCIILDLTFESSTHWSSTCIHQIHNQGSLTPVDLHLALSLVILGYVG